MRVNRDAGGSAAASFQAAFAGAAISYWLIAFVLTNNVLSPLHHDDYSLLGAGMANLRFFVERPVSTNLTFLMGAAGPQMAFLLLNVLAVLVPAAVLAFTFGLLRLRLTWLIAFAFGVMVFCHSSALEHGKYLGLITNLTSHFLGMATLFLMVWMWRRPSGRRLAAALVAYALTALAKEDFLLPPLILLAYFGAELYFPRAGDDLPAPAAEKSWLLRAGAMFVGIAVLSVVFNSLVNSPFTAGVFGAKAAAASPYSADFSPPAIAATFAKLTFTYVKLQTLMFIVAVVALVFLLRARRREVLVLAAITISLVLPYSVIGNQAPTFRAFAWLPWMAALFVALAAVLWQGATERRLARMGAQAAGALVLVAACAIGMQDRKLQANVAEWYHLGQSANSAMLRSVLAQRPAIDSQPVVGLVGLEGLSPWSKNSGNYLRNKLNFANRWVVFVDKPDLFYPLQEDASAYISVVPTAKLCQNPGLTVVRFDKFGNGTTTKAGALCGAAVPDPAAIAPVAAAKP